jgi:cation/acetate symporter
MSETASASSIVVVSTFLLFLAVTLAITWWAARQTKGTRDFYAAGGRITGFQNGLAHRRGLHVRRHVLGITSHLPRGAGCDDYILAPMVGFCLLLMLMVEPFRRLGRFTVSDVAAHRFEEIGAGVRRAHLAYDRPPLSRLADGGAGALVQLLFESPSAPAVVSIGALMVFYVSVGGMMATTWVQIIKAVLMVFGITVRCGDASSLRFDFSRMYREAAEVHGSGRASSYPEVSWKTPGPRSHFRLRWSSASSGFRTS